MNIVKKLAGRKRDGSSQESCRRFRANRKAWAYRPSALVTSTVFDNDDIFSAVANALLFKYETEELSERASLDATIFTSKEREAFLESLDIRNANMYLHQDGEELSDTTPINTLVKKIDSIFGKELRCMWRESVLPTSSSENNEVLDETVEETKYPCPLKTPKNLHSPIITSSESSNTLSSNSKRRRKFFPDAGEQSRCRARIRLDFKLANAANAQPVNSLQLDGFSNSHTLGGYIPPRSPVRAW